MVMPTCACDESYICEACCKRLQELRKKNKESGIHCRVCNGYFEYAAPDKVIPDSKFTCWDCGHSPYKKYKNIPDDKKHLIDKIYP